MQLEKTEHIALAGRLLDRLLALAHRYRAEDLPRQATDLYCKLLESHPDTAQAQAARASLLELAEGYERSGAYREAGAMYWRLLRSAGPSQ